MVFSSTKSHRFIYLAIVLAQISGIRVSTYRSELGVAYCHIHVLSKFKIHILFKKLFLVVSFFQLILLYWSQFWIFFSIASNLRFKRQLATSELRLLMVRQFTRMKNSQSVELSNSLKLLLLKFGFKIIFIYFQTDCCSNLSGLSEYKSKFE